MTKAKPKNICTSRIPDKKIAMIPEVVIKIAVPRSGCLAINKPGTIIINAATTRFLNLGGNDLSE